MAALWNPNLSSKHSRIFISLLSEMENCFLFGFWLIQGDVSHVLTLFPFIVTLQRLSGWALIAYFEMFRNVFGKVKVPMM